MYMLTLTRYNRYTFPKEIVLSYLKWLQKAHNIMEKYISENAIIYFMLHKH